MGWGRHLFPSISFQWLYTRRNLIFLFVYQLSKHQVWRGRSSLQVFLSWKKILGKKPFCNTFFFFFNYIHRNCICTKVDITFQGRKYTFRCPTSTAINFSGARISTTLCSCWPKYDTTLCEQHTYQKQQNLRVAHSSVFCLQLYVLQSSGIQN